MIRRAACEPRGWLVAAFAVFALTPRAARAADDPVGAEALFGEARDLVDKGDWEHGCPKFEASVKMHASSSTWINIARCDEHFGKLANAVVVYRRAIADVGETSGAARQKALEEIARAEMKAIEPRVPKLRIEVPNPPPKIMVERDGVEIDPAAFGETLPADPGKHEIVARAPGYAPLRRTIDLPEGQFMSVAIALEPEIVARPLHAANAAPPTQPLPLWAWAAGGAGVVATTLSLVFLVEDISASTALRENCFSDATATGCKPGYDYASDNARKDTSRVLFPVLGAVGVAGIGIGVYGVVTRGKHRPSDAPRPSATLLPWAGDRAGGASLEGRF